jgi:hypothetical protein
VTSCRLEDELPVAVARENCQRMSDLIFMSHALLSLCCAHKVEPSPRVTRNPLHSHVAHTVCLCAAGRSITWCTERPSDIRDSRRHYAGRAPPAAHCTALLHSWTGCDHGVARLFRATLRSRKQHFRTALTPVTTECPTCAPVLQMADGQFNAAAALSEMSRLEAVASELPDRSECGRVWGEQPTNAAALLSVEEALDGEFELLQMVTSVCERETKRDRKGERVCASVRES